MIITDNGGRYQEPENPCFQHNSAMDRKFINVKISRITSVGNMHFIYLESMDAGVNINLGSVVYTGDLQLGIEAGAKAIYSYDGSKLVFPGWTMARDKDYKWKIEANNIKPAGENEFQPQKVQESQKPKIEKSSILCEVFDFYFASVSRLYRMDYDARPLYKKTETMDERIKKIDDLRKWLFVAQDLLNAELPVDKITQEDVRFALSNRGGTRVKNAYGFIKNMIRAYNADIKNSRINKNGQFLKASEKSSVLNVDWSGFRPNTEKNFLKKVQAVIDNRLGGFDAVKMARVKHIYGNRNGNNL